VNSNSMSGWWLCGKLGAFRGVIMALSCVAVLAGACSKSPAKNTPDTGVGGGDTRPANGGDANGSVADHPADTACSTTAAPKSRGAAEACSCDSDCRTGFCADGVCCDTACTDTCKECNLPSSLGVCSLVPFGVQPSHPSQCPAEKALTCGRDGTCDGAGACRKYQSGTTVCKPGACFGDSITGALTCDGNGSCSQSATTPCYPYTCDPTTNKCAGECTTNSQCAAGQSCVAQSCGKKLNGAFAKSAVECLSGYEANGVCCNVACAGSCVSCNLPGSIGRCKPVDFGLPDPGAACAKNDPSTCGTTGVCNGSGACAIYPANTPCVPAACSGGVLSENAQTCDGKGTCQAANLVDCSPYLCSNGACNGSCTSDNDCKSGTACVVTQVRGITTGLCSGKKANGQTCADPTECNSNQCVDGYCCESSCQGACRSCGLPGSLGQCVNAAAGAPDPRSTCSNQGKTSCGTNGMCDGTGACQKYPVGYVCGQDTCVQGAHTPPATCNASGQCVAPRPQNCGPYVCNGQVCYNACTSDSSQCASPNVCDTSKGSCGLKPLGAECGTGSECVSGNCAQGVCCNSTCTSACMACNLAASAGLCNPVADGSPDPQGVCKSTPTASCGNTGACKGGECAFVAQGVNCKVALCATNSEETPPSTCDGAGACVTPLALSCGNFSCGPTTCKSSCVSNADCVVPYTCINNTCGLKPNGTACTGSAECVSGHCTEGICCESACSDDPATGLCRSCKVPGAIAGSCLPVASGTADPKGRCVASPAGASFCSNDGTCNGSGACSPRPASAGCIGASCQAGLFTSQTYCDGKGSCRTPAAPIACAPYTCNDPPTSCRGSCTIATSTTDCSAGEACVGGHCGTKLSPGDTCADTSQCSGSNVCAAEGVCCNTTCSSGCQTCTLNPGVCTDIGIGQSPRDSSCTAVASGKCGYTGKCDGSGVCQLQTNCNDGNACTQTDVCNSSNQCIGNSPKTCSPSDQCHVAGTCNTSSGACSNPAAPNGTTCNDVNACTQSDTCQSGICTGGNTVVCSASDQCHVAGTCNTGTGACSNPAKSNGTPCDDNNANTVSDVCTGGVCAGVDHCIGVTCTASDQCHTAGTCDHATGACSNPAKANGTPCDDNNANTVSDVCTGGVCAGVDHCIGVTCTASDQCHTVGTCDHATGTCSNPAKNNGTPCDDNNANTVADVCTDGVCAGVDHCIGVTCTASDQCHTVGTCDHATGTCSNPAKTNGTPCDDNNANTVSDVCTGGVCAGVDHCIGVTCTASDQCHTAGTCDHATGACSNPAKTNGTSCDDNNANTVADVCTDGVCAGVDHCIGVTCTASDQCHTVGTCDHATGTCSNPDAPNNTPCNDGNASTVGDVCTNGICAGTDSCIGVSCIALDQCHVAGSCDHATGACSNPDAPNNTPCNDGNPNTLGDVCTNGTCAGTDQCAGVTCTALDQCHVAGSCDHATGTCSNPVASADTPCDDSDKCTQTDKCQAGVCVGSNPVTCTAKDQCHVSGTCDPTSGNCSDPTQTDGTPCTGADGCDTACQAGVCAPCP